MAGLEKKAGKRRRPGPGSSASQKPPTNPWQSLAFTDLQRSLDFFPWPERADGFVNPRPDLPPGPEGVSLYSLDKPT